MIRRREFIAALGGTAAWPLTAAGQQQKPIIGWLTTGPGLPPRQAIDRFAGGWPRSAF